MLQIEHLNADFVHPAHTEVPEHRDNDQKQREANYQRRDRRRYSAIELGLSARTRLRFDATINHPGLFFLYRGLFVRPDHAMLRKLVRGIAPRTIPDSWPRDYGFASIQLSPMPMSATSGTSSWTADSISCLRISATRLASLAGASTSSSSCTCINNFAFSFSRLKASST